MAEINLLDMYPKLNRDVDTRSNNITKEDIRIAREFGKDFFDGDRKIGYGGYVYDGRWVKVAEKFRDYYDLNANSHVLDVGCAKGFLLSDFMKVIPEITVAGIDISRYAIENAMEDAKPYVLVANARDLPFKDKSFDLVISINTVHNLPLDECKQALREIERVSRKYSFITVDSWRDDREKDRMQKWNLTAKTYMHTDDWKNLFKEAGYTGDYYWFIP